MTETDSSRYFREIAKAFLARRGAPFVLSPKDLALVSAWKQAGIPLAVVLEGLAAAFDSRATSGRAAHRVLSLQFCEGSVARAFERFRDRKVGGARTKKTAVDKRAVVRAAAEAFLKDIPADVVFLRDIYTDALSKVAEPGVPDDTLEAFDERAERLLEEHADAAERRAAADELRAEYQRMPGDALKRAATVRLVKRMRDRYRIPYLSPFYYS
jgi:hypothetical protein